MKRQFPEDITCRKLEMFLAYMQAGSLTRAADLLDANPVSVHRALHSLEESLRCTLFRHEGRNLIPTPAAHVLANTAEVVLERLAQGIDATREAAGYSSDRLRIGALYSLTIHIVPELIKSMHQRKATLQCELILGRSRDQLIPMLRQGALDAVFSELSAGDPNLTCLPMFDDSVYLAVPLDSRYRDLEYVDLRACAGERIVTLTDGPLTATRLKGVFPEFNPTFAMEVEDIFALMNLVVSGVACALAPGRIREMYDDRVRFIPLRADQQRRQTIGLCFMRARERDPNLLALCSAVRLFVGRPKRMTRVNLPSL